ncbi:hypothetical protein, partial [Staphylococcus saprophyticus]|uniref:hypothetical protein n=1 Tax=Staphylococcus saprophyticus TaxID=29385 RepID=UPI0011A7A070
MNEERFGDKELMTVGEMCWTRIDDCVKYIWGEGEELGFATISENGRGIRLSGQDSEGGRFSDGDGVLDEAEIGAEHVASQNVAD